MQALKLLVRSARLRADKLLSLSLVQPSGQLSEAVGVVSTMAKNSLLQTKEALLERSTRRAEGGEAAASVSLAREV